MPARRLLLLTAALATTASLLPGCASLSGPPPLHVGLAGIESLAGEGLELRFLLKLRVQNRSDTDLRYDGVWIEIDLAGLPLASGTAPLTGLVPRFGEVVLALPVSASGLSLARQAIGLMRSAREGAGIGPVKYALRGGLGGLGYGGGRFQSSGEIDLGASGH